MKRLIQDGIPNHETVLLSIIDPALCGNAGCIASKDDK
jgi:hypothetical protein